MASAGRGTQHSQPTSAGPTLPGQQERTQFWHGWKTAKSCTLHVQALDSPRAPLPRKAQSLLPFHCSLNHSETLPSPVLLILQLLQALKLLKTQQKHCALKGWTNLVYSPQPDKYNCFPTDHKNCLEDFSPPAGNKVVDCCRFLTSQADCLAI